MVTRFVETAATALALMVLGTGVAHAQDQAAPAAEASAGSAADSNDGQDGGEIVVTALRRESTVSRTPAALSVMGGGELRNTGVVSALNLPDVMPNIQNGVAGFTIRGISSGDTTAKGDPSTAFSINGIYIARPQEQGLTFLDVERVEVLRGPQGTLYGRNATAGAVNVISNRPRDEFQAAGSVEIGNYETRRAELMVNLPAAPGFAVRAAASINKHDGFSPTGNGRAALDDQDDLSLRLSASAEITPSIRLLVIGDYGRARPTGLGYTAVAQALSTTGINRRRTNPGGDSRQNLEAGGITTQFDADLGFANLTYLFGYRKSTNDYVQYYRDNGPFVDQQNDHSQTSHELRLASSGSGPLQWVAGLFYFTEDQRTVTLVNLSPTLRLNFDLPTQIESKAAFAQVTYSLTGSLRVTGGIRYTDDQKVRTGTQIVNGGTPIPFNAKVDYSKWNWKIGIDQDLGSNGLIYASISTGYKAGGFNDGNPTTQPALYYDPEDVRAIEGGVKVKPFDGLQLAVAGFHYDYKGLQLSSVPPTGGILTLNAAQATVYGAEVEGTWRVVRNGRFDFNVSWLNATYDEYRPSGASGVNWAGRRLDRSPAFTARIAYQHDIELGDGSRITPQASTRYSSSYFVSNFSGPVQYRQDAYWRTDFSLTYHAPKDRWYVQAFARNLEDESTLSTFSMGALHFNEPRLYGARLGFRF